jgi:general secretion pathway protein K
MREAGDRTRWLRGRGGMPRDRGFALLIVLWSLSLLALIGTHIVATGRAEAQLAANLRTAAAAEAAADGAFYQAVFHLLDGSPRRWLPDGSTRELALPGGGVARVRIVSENAKINPNTAAEELLQALLLRLGTDPRRAAALAAAILDWRTAGLRPRRMGAKEPQYRAASRDYAPPGKPVESLDELGLILGMTPDLLAALKPHLSLYNEGEPDLLLAHPLVARAVADTTDAAVAAESSVGPAAATVVSITAVAVLPEGSSFVRHAHVRLGSGTRGRAWQILTWHAADAW